MSATLSSGTLLQGGRYRIERVLGQGGFGITYLATHTGFGQKVALKEFYMKELCVRNEETSHVTLGTGESSATVERFRGKFLKEARNLFRLNHKHIVRVLDIFEENGTAYFAMEYAEGGSLSQKVKAEGALSESVATRYILQVAEALAYLHEQKMNHLDVKPANIMLSASDDAVLIDFGLAKQYDAAGSQTSTTPAGISEGYAPTEQYKLGGVAEFTPETDIYALGATFFKLLTGVTPPSAQNVFEDGVPIETLRQHGVSEVAINVIEQAMNPSKKVRMNNAKAFIDTTNSASPLQKRHTSKKWWGIGIVAICVLFIFFMQKKGDGGNDEIPSDKDNDSIVVDAVSVNGSIDGHDYVDLGLPSGTLWATCNVGAAKPEELGDCFVWGEVEPCKEYHYFGANDKRFKSQYNNKGGKTILDSFDDAATVNWGQEWRIPNWQDVIEIKKYCSCSWATYNGIEGYLVESKSNHNTLFLPTIFAGYGRYWLSSINSSDNFFAYSLGFDCSGIDSTYNERPCDFPLRPICVKKYKTQ